ncbi:MAG: lipoyl(octanoyl) transferase LipB [Acidobacteriota bacterium]
MSDPPAGSAGRELRWSWLGRVPYRRAWTLQQEAREALHRGHGPERLLLLEHDPVFTLGRNASADDVLAGPDWLHARGLEVVETNRGGQVTYHGPGQLMAYPIVDLKPDRRDVRRYVRDLQATIVATLEDLGITARRRDGQALIGVWVEDRKIASIGVHLSRWITQHGFALNVEPELAHFGGIVACGLPQVTMTSIALELPAGSPPPALPALAEAVANHFAARLNRRLVADSQPAGARSARAS